MTAWVLRVSVKFDTIFDVVFDEGNTFLSEWLLSKLAEARLLIDGGGFGDDKLFKCCAYSFNSSQQIQQASDVGGVRVPIRPEEVDEGTSMFWGKIIRKER